MSEKLETNSKNSNVMQKVSDRNEQKFLLALFYCIQIKFTLFEILVKNLRKTKTKEDMAYLLGKYNIPYIEQLEFTILIFLEYIDETEKHKYVEILVEANNLPIIRECNCIISSSLNYKQYAEKYPSSYPKQRYKKCMEFINLSVTLKEKEKKVKEFWISAEPKEKGRKVIRRNNLFNLF